jgi:hypothetical protein
MPGIAEQREFPLAHGVTRLETDGAVLAGCGKESCERLRDYGFAADRAAVAGDEGGIFFVERDQAVEVARGERTGEVGIGGPG